MPTLTIKHVPEALHRRLKERAKRNRRSLNSEVIVCLEEAANQQAFDPGRWLRKADELRAKIKVTPLTDEMLLEAKNRGRP